MGRWRFWGSFQRTEPPAVLYLAMQFRFTVRDLLWLTLVLALAAGWWFDHMRIPPSLLFRPPHVADLR